MYKRTNLDKYKNSTGPPSPSFNGYCNLSKVIVISFLNAA